MCGRQPLANTTPWRRIVYKHILLQIQPPPRLLHRPHLGRQLVRPRAQPSPLPTSSSSASALFHGVALERLDFGPVGWNDDSYGFDLSDLNISLRQLREMSVGMRRDELSEEVLPLRAVHYLTAECNYGGRVTGRTGNS